MSIVKQFFLACLLVLAGAFALVLAVDFLASIWGWLVGFGALALSVVVTVIVVRFRRNRW